MRFINPIRGNTARLKKKQIFDTVEIRTIGQIESTADILDSASEKEGIALKKSADSDESTRKSPDEKTKWESSDQGVYGDPQVHLENLQTKYEAEKQKEQCFRKELNQKSRESVSGSIHERVRLIIHRPDYTLENEQEYAQLSQQVMPIVRELARKTLPLLRHENTCEFTRNHYYGSRFQADNIASQDFRNFARKRPPTENPSLVVGLRIDESASMAAFGRLDAAKRAAIAVYEFCWMCHIPVLIYGDTADTSKMEQMSIYAYADYDKAHFDDRFKLMGIHGRTNNRDGMALRIMAERFVTLPQQTKLIISMSDGQPKAMEDYTGGYAAKDMQQTLAEYERKGITFLAAAIGQDKEIISQIYTQERFLDITDLKELPAKLVRLITRYL